jgi:hypothetical protein
MHSPFRHGDSKKDLQPRNVLKKSGPESAVRGNQLITESKPNDLGRRIQ